MSATLPKIRQARRACGDGGAIRCRSSSPLFTISSYSRGRSFLNSSRGTPPVKITVSMGNFSGRKCVLKKCTVKMKATASSASSLWTMVAMLIDQPGSRRVKKVGNHSTRPVLPITATPQKTAK